MFYIIQFEDKPDMGELREKLLEAHFQFLDLMKDRVVAAADHHMPFLDQQVTGMVVRGELPWGQQQVKLATFQLRRHVLAWRTYIEVQARRNFCKFRH